MAIQIRRPEFRLFAAWVQQQACLHGRCLICFPTAARNPPSETGHVESRSRVKPV